MPCVRRVFVARLFVDGPMRKSAAQPHNTLASNRALFRLVSDVQYDVTTVEYDGVSMLARPGSFCWS